jgi:hypothetical protein
MAFSDPQSLTINATPVSLPRTAFGTNSGAFTSADGPVKLSISHQKGNRNRHVVRVDHNKVAPDPLISSQNIKFSMSAYAVFDVPPTGYTASEAKQVGDALTAFLTANSGANITRVLGDEI